MLSLFRNQALTRISKEAVELRQMELDWLCNNLWMIAGRAGLLSGFAFGQFGAPIPDSFFVFEIVYFLVAITCIASQFLIVMVCTYVTVWGRGLALRGPDGFDSVMRALRIMRKQQKRIIVFFIFGLCCFLLNSLLMCFMFDNKKEGLVGSLIMAGIAVYFIFWTLKLSDEFHYKKGVDSGIPLVEDTYGRIGDLDATANGRR